MRSVRTGIMLVIATLCAALLTGCTQTSRYYATNKSDGVYFALPHGWKKVSQKELAAQESLSTATGAAERAASVHWQEAYVVDSTLDAKQVLSLKTPNTPIVYARVRSLLPEEINSVSYNSLRDLVVPLTGWVNGTVKSPTLDIAVDEERVEKGARGVHSVFTFGNVDGTSQTIDQTALLSTDHTIIYVLMIRCSSQCYEKNRSTLEKVAASFTVRGK